MPNLDHIQQGRLTVLVSVLSRNAAYIPVFTVSACTVFYPFLDWTPSRDQHPEL